MELMDHLAELRTRIIRSVLYVIGGMILTYNLFNQLYSLITYPLSPIMSKLTYGTIAVTGIQSAFFIRMQVSLVSGIAVAVPFIILELWGFIEPALTVEERKPVKYLAPFSVLALPGGYRHGIRRASGDVLVDGVVYHRPAQRQSDSGRAAVHRADGEDHSRPLESPFSFRSSCSSSRVSD